MHLGFQFQQMGSSRAKLYSGCTAVSERSRMAYSTRSRARSIRGSTYLLNVAWDGNKRGVVLERLRLNRT